MQIDNLVVLSVMEELRNRRQIKAKNKDKTFSLFFKMTDKIEPEWTASYTAKTEPIIFSEKYTRQSIPKISGLLNLQTHVEVYFW